MNAAPRIVTIGETFSATLALSADSVKTFATLVNDLNPLHHDEAYAAQSRFGGLIASGTQPTAHFMALLATHFSTHAQPLGLEFDIKLKKAAHAGDTLGDDMACARCLLEAEPARRPDASGRHGQESARRSDRCGRIDHSRDAEARSVRRREHQHGHAMTELTTALTIALPASVRVFERGWLSSNNVLLIDNDCAALVDTGYATHAQQTRALVQQTLGERPLDLIVNTHLHSDHCGGNALLQATWPCRTLIPACEAGAVRDWDEARLTFRATAQTCERFVFTGTIAPGVMLRLGALDWQVLGAPGHDPHSLMLYCAAERLLISADALWENGFGVIFPELEGESGFAEQQAVLEAIAALDVRVVIPGHGAPFTQRRAGAGARFLAARVAAGRSGAQCKECAEGIDRIQATRCARNELRGVAGDARRRCGNARGGLDAETARRSGRRLSKRPSTSWLPGTGRLRWMVKRSSRDSAATGNAVVQ